MTLYYQMNSRKFKIKGKQDLLNNSKENAVLTSIK